MCNLAEKYYPTLQASSLFRQIPRDKYMNVLTCLQAQDKTFDRDCLITSAGDSNGRAGIILKGVVEGFLYDENGNQVIIRHLYAGDVFCAESACAGQFSSQIFLRASSEAEVLLLNFGILLSDKTLTCPYRMQVTANLMQEFARQVLYFNTRVRILSQKKLRDKLKIYLQTLQITSSGIINLPFNRNKLAEFLYFDRSALSRELCRLRDEGILLFSGSRITLLDMKFLTE